MAERRAPARDASWREILPRTPLQPDRGTSSTPRSRRTRRSRTCGSNIYPDGGVARLRLFGRAAASARERAVDARSTRLNASRRGAAERELLDCCGCAALGARGWRRRARSPSADEVCTRPPNASGRARAPRTGSRRSPRTRGSATIDGAAQSARGERWSRHEQADARAGGGADERCARRSPTANRRYEQRFGYIYIVCATGRSADEMLAPARGAARQRAATASSRVAADEQRKITPAAAGEAAASDS